MEPHADFTKIGLEKFVFLDENYARKGRFSAPLKHPTPPSFSASQGSQAFLYQHHSQKPCIYQSNQVYAREEMIIKHEAKPEPAKVELEGFALMQEYYGRKGRVADPQRREEMIIQNHEAKPQLVKIDLQGFALMDEYYGRKGRHAAPQRRDEIIIQNHEAKAEVADRVLERFASMDEYYGLKWRVAAPQKPPIPQRHAIIQGSKQQNLYYQSQPEQPYIHRVKPASSQHYIYQVKPASGKEKLVIDAYEAAKLHGELLIIDYSNRK